MTVFAVTSEVADVVRALDAAPKGLRDAVARTTAQYMLPAWQEELNQRTPANRTQAKVLMTDPKAASFPLGFAIEAGGSMVPLSGGLVPAEYARAFEFGTAIPKQTPFTQRSRAGNWYQVRGKHTNAQMPGRSRTGWIAYPAATKIADRIIALWMQTVVREYHDAIDRV